MIRDPHRLVSRVTDECPAKVIAAIGREAKLLFWRADGWEVVLLDRASVSSGDGDGAAFDAIGACHEG